MAQETEQVPAPAEPHGPSKVARTRQIVLLIILAFAILALIWEFKVARPQSELAWKEVDKLQMTNYSTDGEVTNTNETVRQVIGKAASEVSEVDHEVTEVYSWRRGLPLLAYKIYVVYDKRDDGRLLLNSAHLNRPPKEDFDVSQPDPGSPAANHAPPSTVAEQEEPGAILGSENTSDDIEQANDVDAAQP